MKGKLEDYIAEHRADFEEHKANKLKLWHRIENELSETKELKKEKQFWNHPMLKVAASVIVLLGSVLAFNILYTPAFENEVVNEVVNEELYDIDMHYKQLVNSQIQLVKKLPNLSIEEQSDFLLLIDDLDQEYNKLILELKQDIDNQKIIEAIIHNYRKKIQHMEDLLQRSYLPKTNIDENEFIL